MKRREFLGAVLAAAVAPCLPKVVEAVKPRPQAPPVGTVDWASGEITLHRGDVFMVEGVYGVNPGTYQSTGYLQKFVATANVTMTDRAVLVPELFQPRAITDGFYQTVCGDTKDLGCGIPAKRIRPYVFGGPLK